MFTSFKLKSHYVNPDSFHDVQICCLRASIVFSFRTFHLMCMLLCTAGFQPGDIKKMTEMTELHSADKQLTS